MMDPARDTNPDARPVGLAARFGALTRCTDEEIVARVLAGDAAAFELLMRRYNQRLFRLAWAVLRDDADAEDVVQQAYVDAYTSLAGFEGRSSVATWLSRITLYSALRVRKGRGRLRLTEPLALDDLTAPEKDDLAMDDLDVPKARDMLVAALDALPETYRVVVMLRLVEGLSTHETAASLGITEANVKVRLHRAKRQLGDRLRHTAIREIREHLAFAGERCDRIVVGVMARLREIDAAARPFPPS